MKTEITLRIIDLADGRWKFDLKAGMNDEELWKLLTRLKYVESELKGLLETDLIQATETIEYLKQKKK